MSGNTPVRAIRIPTELWEAALRQAQDEGTTVTAVVLKALHDFVTGPPPS